MSSSTVREVQYAPANVQTMESRWELLISTTASRLRKDFPTRCSMENRSRLGKSACRPERSCSHPGDRRTKSTLHHTTSPLLPFSHSLRQPQM
jgi:hypothetical protein